MPRLRLRRAAGSVVLVAVFPFLLLAPGWLRARPVHAEPPPAGAVPYRPPVDGPVVEPFHVEHPFGPGNRGIDYAVAPLTPVRAAADGEVIFAGSVAGTLHVTIRHADGLRTSYSFLASVDVRAGQTVRAGDVVGRSVEVVHFGVRDPTGTYLDPATLFSAGRRARLVPGGDDGTRPAGPGELPELGALVAERLAPLDAHLARLAGPVGPLPGNGLVDRTRVWAHTLAEMMSATHERRIADGLMSWASTSAACTPAGEPPPRRAGRRILLQVAGIGSTSEQAAVADVDHTGLGYAATDVVRFSYAGGRVPAPDAPGALARIAASPYTAADSQTDLRVSAARLAGLLDAVGRAEPGVPIDVVAHSQGGVVARLALAEAERRGRLPPAVATLVTLATPHQGADLAHAVVAGRLSDRGQRLVADARARLGIDLDPSAPAAAQLAPTSAVIDELRSLAPPASVRVVSVGARGDLVVPANRTAAAGVTSTVVSLSGPRAHDRLPGSPEASREIALAIAGHGPTCRSLVATALDLGISERISRAESMLALPGVGASLLEVEP